MTKRVLIIPQGEVATNSGTGGGLQLRLTTRASPGHEIIGFIYKYVPTYTATIGGTIESVSLGIHDIQITNERGKNVAAIDSQALGPLSLEAFQELTELGIAYQAYIDLECQATTVASPSVYTVMAKFQGRVFSHLWNLNVPTAITGLTAPTAATYQLQVATIETTPDSHSSGKSVVPPKPIYHRIVAEYHNDSTFTGKAPTRHLTVAVDNVELSTIVDNIHAGGKDFNSAQAALAEEVFAATIPDGITVSSAFTGQATVPPTNPQTDSPLGIASFGGPTADIPAISFNTTSKFVAISRVPM